MTSLCNMERLILVPRSVYHLSKNGLLEKPLPGRGMGLLGLLNQLKPLHRFGETRLQGKRLLIVCPSGGKVPFSVVDLGDEASNVSRVAADLFGQARELQRLLVIFHQHVRRRAMIQCKEIVRVFIEDVFTFLNSNRWICAESQVDLS